MAAAIVRRHGAARIGVVMGTSTSGMAEGEAALAARLDDGAWPAGYGYSRQELGNLATSWRARAACAGPAYTVATACSSSGKVFASAARLIEAGLCDAALVGGADTLCRHDGRRLCVARGDCRGLCNPFSRNRDGINIGEGAAVFLMSRAPSAGGAAGRRRKLGRPSCQRARP